MSSGSHNAGIQSWVPVTPKRSSSHAQPYFALIYKVWRGRWWSYKGLLYPDHLLQSNARCTGRLSLRPRLHKELSSQRPRTPIPRWQQQRKENGCLLRRTGKGEAGQQERHAEEMQFKAIKTVSLVILRGGLPERPQQQPNPSWSHSGHPPCRALPPADSCAAP